MREEQQGLVNLCGKTVGIYWDLDNVVPSSLPSDLVPAAEEARVSKLILLLCTLCTGAMPGMVPLYRESFRLAG